MTSEHFLNQFMLYSPHQDGHYDFALPHQQEQLKKAAVLLALRRTKLGFNLLFTQRALHLKHHPGQVSFPGGRYEKSDQNIAFTALRETEEEIGINKESIQLLGKLPTLTTISGYHVSPFIGLIEAKQDIILDENEVRGYFEAPLEFVLNPNNFYLQPLIANKQRRETYCCVYQNHFIWGATAQILVNLQQHLHYVPRRSQPKG